MKELEKMLQKEDRETSELGHLKQRLLEELEDERKTHQQQLEGLNFTMDQTRNKYQGKPSIMTNIKSVLMPRSGTWPA